MTFEMKCACYWLTCWGTLHSDTRPIVFAPEEGLYIYTVIPFLECDIYHTILIIYHNYTPPGSQWFQPQGWVPAKDAFLIVLWNLTCLWCQTSIS